VIGAIPYRTFPQIHLGSFSIHTFGVMVAIGVLVGAWIASRYARRQGISEQEVAGLIWRVVVAGFVGARIAWDLSHTSQIHSPLDLIAVWHGGLAFTGGFIAAVLVALPTLRRWAGLQRWRLADGIALGLTVGLAIGRIGCISVGEHLGNPTHFFLGWKYLGGPTREGPLVVGVTYNNTAIYEFLHLWLLAALLWWLIFHRKDTIPGTAIGVFCLWYGVARFCTDFLRTHDDRFLGLTAAQWTCMLLVAAGIWILATTGRRRARLELEHYEPAPEPQPTSQVADP
jgi:phosphatidylglycerol---prolipoprotein diacylglyceryl transferase